MDTAIASAPELNRHRTLAAAPIVFVVDDDLSVRESLEMLIVSSGRTAEVFASAAEFLERGAPAVPSCLLLDLTLPDLNGLELQRHMAAAAIAIPIIFITGYTDIPMTVSAMKAGAMEFLTKPLHGDALLRAIDAALARSRDLLAAAAQARALRDRYALLTRRERQVMSLVIIGRLNKQVGAELGISEVTVKAHRGQVMRKMHADSLPDLVNLAARLGPGA